jgi:2-polyprenyl-3-methyl-5-hydroxy-6-metoxy-1,4-benzoquinol methylase
MKHPDRAAQIASFPTWHYDFELDGHHTNPAKAEWQNLRAEHLIDPLVAHYGGTLEGRRVLDLGCNAGFFSLRAAEAGCDFVLGIDGRQTHIDQANLVFEAKGVDPNRYRFACGNILEFDYDAVPAGDHSRKQRSAADRHEALVRARGLAGVATRQPADPPGCGRL